MKKIGGNKIQGIVLVDSTDLNLAFWNTKQKFL